MHVEYVVLCRYELTAQKAHCLKGKWKSVLKSAAALAQIESGAVCASLFIFASYSIKANPHRQDTHTIVNCYVAQIACSQYTRRWYEKGINGKERIVEEKILDSISHSASLNLSSALSCLLK